MLAEQLISIQRQQIIHPVRQIVPLVRIMVYQHITIHNHMHIIIIIPVKNKLYKKATLPKNF